MFRQFINGLKYFEKLWKAGKITLELMMGFLGNLGQVKEILDILGKSWDTLDYYEY